jgi:outer membrane protein W
MKKIILSAALVAIAGLTYAQKPAAGAVTGEIQLNFQTGTSAVNVVSPDLKARYFLADDLALRINFGVTSSSTSYDVAENPDGTGSTGTVEASASGFSIGVGIEKHFAGTERLSPYIGASIGYSSNSSDATLTNAAYDPTFGDYMYANGYSSTQDNGAVSTFGIKLLAGADYYFVNNVYLGVEVGWGFSSSSEGDTKTVDVTPAGSSTSVSPGGSSSSLSVSTNPGLRLGFRF